MADSPPQQPAHNPLTVPVLEEQLKIGTRTVDLGRGVRIHKTVAEHPVAVDERLLQDEVEITRVAVDRLVAAGETPGTRYEGDTLVVPVLEEVLVVERRVRIKEELRITRRQREEQSHDTAVLRSEQVSIERFDETERTPPR